MIDQAVLAGPVLAPAGRGGRPVIAVATPHYRPIVGGLERYAERVVQAIRESDDLDALVITSNPDGPRTSVDIAFGYQVVRLPTFATLSRTPISPFWTEQIRRIYLRHGVALVHAHSPVAGLPDQAVLAAGRRPVVVTYHSGSMVKGDHVLDPALRGYEKVILPRLFARADTLVAVSSTSLAAACAGARTIPPGVDTRSFVPAAEPRYDVRSVLYVGSVDDSTRWKGLDTLIEALALVRWAGVDAHLDVVGPGGATDTYRRIAAGVGAADAVRFHGPLHGDELLRTYQDAGVVVLASRSEAESFGMVLAEAMACARPVIGSRAGGIPSVFDDGEQGFLVPPGDARALSEAIVRVLGDPELAARLGSSGRRRVEQHLTWDRVIAAYLDIYRELLAAGPRPRRRISSLGGAR
ncbi:LPS biosynthesis rfbu related protein [Frankia sp. AiPs1]|uniref:glycosyltransferase family 4 protein n=1 Tax=Frankia sp. AiPa1 TaxID=573492 RepID=UPI00202B515A|nr:glycosyltransferase family 4 protein [Frankia sp. AiPa1]MCL9758334.1 glycosyltransferase family 4 protein [Frankia sp. AiPa1]